MKKIIITALILISIISCNSKKADNTEVTANTNAVNTNNTEISNNDEYVEDNNTEEINSDTAEISEVPGWDLEAFNDLKNVKDAESLKSFEEKHGERSLIMALQYGDKKMVTELLSYGANVDQTYVDNDSPLKTASAKGYLELVKEFIKRGADVNFIGEGNIDALHSAVMSTNENSLKIMKELLEAGAEVDLEYGWEEPVPILFETIGYVGESKCYLDKFKMLAEYGADINYVDSYGYPLIRYAVQSGCLDIVKYLVSKGIDPAMKYELKEYYPNVNISLLASTLYNSDTEMAKYLIEQGADVNTPIPSEDGYPLLLQAIDNGKTELVKLLIEKGADTTVVNKEKKTVFDIAREKGYDDIVALDK
ncbi:ankyrin repeat domain-containing protein [Brachyspira hyodysenteriae]|uniref:ankyrin repeat domain-containing protein n=1 Tax=Brachyspira hyodysenteriae TaxID=159 RepID=UPI0022CDB010|nr:ankyrin repeat domain-containing protein [Brachyspira hyodysenteriae]MCZ9839336.1 ankyrin repeat domain-containing protein [Brachyspira hyodysenteriae]MCZ9846985.1 ankyrin repeat domain-containing protein [Brachyspira hyodysenteriae]MCZ9850840.1 ankyrin repeat domain-containing protein [Brachyspira hyodysenteriae]MCZ9860407.1 ankyrin repeat domain-containing protein [Brachyspira hyodysenteriae]MCZ9869312.1 ankyrin repeat domain-containing protein [Brachyspira hyodysenteriae]